MAYTTSVNPATFTTALATATQFEHIFASPLGPIRSTTFTSTYTDTWDGIVFVDVIVTITENVEATCENMIKFGMALQPNPDVSGLGVILAFVISAYLVQSWSVFAYFTGLLPPSLLRPVDKRVMKANSRNVDSQWHEALEKAAIIFSDQQIITGIGILLAGYCNLGAGLSVYHWQIITYLAWMSSNVHLTTLTLLREWLQTNKTLRRWRVMGMALLMVLLVAALIPTRTEEWVIALTDTQDYGPGILTETSDGSYVEIYEAGAPINGLGVPCKCFWGTNPALDGDLNLDAPWAFVILIVSYVWKMGQLFDTSRLHLKKWFRSGPEWLLERGAVKALQKKAKGTTGGETLGPRIKYRVIMIVYVPIIAFFEFFDSFLASLWLLTIGLAWGSVQIFQTRVSAPPQVSSAESYWGFGQILPMLFLLQPAAALFEHFYASHNASHQQKLSASFAKPVLLKIRSNLGFDKDKSSVTALSASRSTTMTDLETATTPRQTVQRMSDILKHLEPKRPSAKADLTALETHIDFMYTSRFFVVLVWLINLCVFCCAMVVFLSVGNVLPLYHNTWALSLWSIIASCACISVISCCASLSSKLYK